MTLNYIHVSVTVIILCRGKQSIIGFSVVVVAGDIKLNTCFCNCHNNRRVQQYKVYFSVAVVAGDIKIHTRFND